MKMRLTIETATDYAMTLKPAEAFDIELPAGTKMRIIKHTDWVVIDLNTYAVTQCMNAKELSKAIETVYTLDFHKSLAA
jgi:hypothetical protein